ncbi:hypothetical protein B0T26DRAFT_435261 [Lasiosphaeria miniovina]|uniref:Uncharacterized protein n=1 Tax=Lasiosphaeria miniovina TaxID=1954250 RepID=A0AA40A6M3_9PEZI|nr:uncharacterized protein B0T26DRAFT_435261 [Lasiosphaeria miniovina]KAK0710288.1 hypothetical protein B0T26DRAFT_435261 [Lasiosphaeria miniovina]
MGDDPHCFAASRIVDGDAMRLLRRGRRTLWHLHLHLPQTTPRAFLISHRIASKTPRDPRGGASSGDTTSRRCSSLHELRRRRHPNRAGSALRCPAQPSPALPRRPPNRLDTLERTTCSVIQPSPDDRD